MEQPGLELQYSDIVAADTVTTFLGVACGGVTISIFSVHGGEFEGCISASSARDLATALLKIAADAESADRQGGNR